MFKTIAVTGASGHIGNVVCRMLLDQGYRVKALYNTDNKGLTGLPVALVKGSVLHQPDLEQLMAGCDAVIHCAAVISIHGDPSGIVFKTNTEGPANVLAVSQRLGIKKMLHLSSVHAVHETPATGVFDETRPYKGPGDFVYDHSKAEGEQRLMRLAEQGAVEVVILRPSSVVGPYDFKPSELGKALVDFFYQKIPVLPPGGFDFVDVRDVANSIILALENGKNKEIYQLSGKYYSMKDMAALITKITGKKTPSVVMPFWMLKWCLPIIGLYSKITGAAPQFSKESISALKLGHKHMDHSKAKRDLGHNPRDFEETLRDFFNWKINNNQP